MFSFYLDRNPTNSNSVINFGGIDEELFEGELVYHDVTNENYWSIDA